LILSAVRSIASFLNQNPFERLCVVDLSPCKVKLIQVHVRILSVLP